MRIIILLLLVSMVSCGSTTITAERTTNVTTDSTTTIRVRTVNVEGASGQATLPLNDFLSSGTATLTMYSPVYVRGDSGKPQKPITVSLEKRGTTAVVYVDCPDTEITVADTTTRVRKDSTHNQTNRVTEEPSFFEKLFSEIKHTIFLFVLGASIVAGILWYSNHKKT